LGFGSPASSLTPEHLLEFIEDVTEGALASPTLRSLKLIREAFESGESLPASEGPASSEGTLPTERVLSLLIASHSCLVIDATLTVIAECLVRVVNLGKLLLGLSTRVHIWMVLLRQLKVGFFDI